MTVISGGQTGVDQAALFAARDAGLLTGGWAPLGWRTQAGPAPWLADFGLRAHASADYGPRTDQNVADASAVLIFGDATSPGCQRTASAANRFGRPARVVRWHPGLPLPDAADIRAWLVRVRPAVLDVAGNREESAPGIYWFAYWFLLPLFQEISHGS
jgi:hypothetical protein